MSFQDFVGNPETVGRLRGMLTRDRFPHALILSGPEGSGKFTLAQMLAKAMNCQTRPVSAGLADFCGVCENCRRIAQADDLEARFAEAVEAREGMRDADKRETRILIQSHPDVLILPPDPPQMMIKIDQVRRVTESVYYRPSAGGRRVYIFTESSFMKEAANAMLKVLEEPPEFATLILLACNAGELLPTIRSRALEFSLAPLPVEEIAQLLARQHPEWGAKQRALVARLSGGAFGKACGLDLAAYVAAREDALVVLQSAVNSEDHSPLFKVTETYRAGAEGRKKTEQLLRVLYSLLQDLMYIKSGAPELVRNSDLARELERLANSLDFAWIAYAVNGLGKVESGMRRNLLRSLSLDAFATALER